MCVERWPLRLLHWPESGSRKFVWTKPGVAQPSAVTVIAMGLFSWWDRYRMRTVTSKVLKAVTPPCAILAFLLSVGSACSGSAPRDDEPLKNFAAAATVVFLKATSDNPGKFSDYFPGIDPKSAGLPARADTLYAVLPGTPQSRGADTWAIPVSVANNTTGGECWQLLIHANTEGGRQKFAATQLPSPWPAEAPDKDQPARTEQKLSPEHPATKTVTGFLTAWMNGKSDDIGRYVTSIDVAPPWTQRPFTSADVVAVRAAGSVPEEAKGTATVTASVVISDRHNRPGSYRIQLKAVNKQWVVSAINPAE